MVLYQKKEKLVKAETFLEKMEEQFPGAYHVPMRKAFIEALKQSKIENSKKDYSKMKAYYEKALNLYKEEEMEREMLLLKKWIEKLKEQKWIE